MFYTNMTRNMYLKYWLRFVIVGTSITSWFLCKSPNKLNGKLQKMQTGIVGKWAVMQSYVRVIESTILIHDFEIVPTMCYYVPFCYSIFLILQNHNLFFFNLFLLLTFRYATVYIGIFVLLNDITIRNNHVFLYTSNEDYRG